MMHKGRLEAFSDGVFAIIITIMVLELKVPHGGNDLKALIPVIPVFISYILSFIYVGIYWNNHHHMLQAAKSVNGRILWANLHLLFWLSLIPFVTAWMGENHFSQWPIALYGFVMVMNAFAYSILSNFLIKHEGKNSNLSKAIGKGRKGMISVALYLTAITLSMFNSWISFALYVLVAIIWFIPDSRIEKGLAEEK
ncbi:TMEM175 family protein [Pedobacter sp. NJ-S-72]